MADLTSRKSQANKIVSNIERIGSLSKKKSDKLYDEAVDDVIKYNDEKTPFVATSLTVKGIDNKMRRIVISTEDSFEDIIRQTQRYLAQGYDIDLTQADLRAISQAESVLVDRLINNTDILKNDIKAILYSNLGKGIPRSQLVKELKDLYPAYARNAETIINTGLGRQYQDISTSKFIDTSFQWYIWAGPNDKKTRENPCRHWVNHKFLASQLPTLRATRGSLWNCRHSIIPIDEKEAKDYPIGNISFAL